VSAHRAEQQEEDQPVGMAVLRVLSGRTQGVSTGSARPATHWLGRARPSDGKNERSHAPSVWLSCRTAL
jgi:hypothetical protein